MIKKTKKKVKTVKKLSAKMLKTKYKFKQSSPTGLKGLSTTIRRSFALRLRDRTQFSEADILKALKDLNMTQKNMKCIYCGSKATLWDHFHSLIKDTQPQYIKPNIKAHVPSCDRCNESRGNKNWKEWIEKKKGKKEWWGKADDKERHVLLDKYSRSYRPKKVEPEEIYGKNKINNYNKIKNQIIKLLEEAENLVKTKKKLKK